MISNVNISHCYVSVLDLATAGHTERPVSGSMPRSCTTEALYRCHLELYCKAWLRAEGLRWVILIKSRSHMV